MEKHRGMQVEDNLQNNPSQSFVHKAMQGCHVCSSAGMNDVLVCCSENNQLQEHRKSQQMHHGIHQEVSKRLQLQHSRHWLGLMGVVLQQHLQSQQHFACAWHTLCPFPPVHNKLLVCLSVWNASARIIYVFQSRRMYSSPN